MFRFTIRDVLWLTVVVGMGAAWWADHSTQRALLGRVVNKYSALSEASQFVVETLPDGTYRAWDGPKQKPDGTWEYPNKEMSGPYP
jgi:hypothetical protein